MIFDQGSIVLMPYRWWNARSNSFPSASRRTTKGVWFSKILKKLIQIFVNFIFLVAKTWRIWSVRINAAVQRWDHMGEIILILLWSCCTLFESFLLNFVLKRLLHTKKEAIRSTEHLKRTCIKNCQFEISDNFGKLEIRNLVLSTALWTALKTDSHFVVSFNENKA